MPGLCVIAAASNAPLPQLLLLLGTLVTSSPDTPSGAHAIWLAVQKPTCNKFKKMGTSLAKPGVIKARSSSEWPSRGLASGTLDCLLCRLCRGWRVVGAGSGQGVRGGSRRQNRHWVGEVPQQSALALPTEPHAGFHGICAPQRAGCGLAGKGLGPQTGMKSFHITQP